MSLFGRSEEVIENLVRNISRSNADHGSFHMLSDNMFLQTLGRYWRFAVTECNPFYYLTTLVNSYNKSCRTGKPLVVSSYGMWWPIDAVTLSTCVWIYVGTYVLSTY